MGSLFSMLWSRRRGTNEDNTEASDDETRALNEAIAEGGEILFPDGSTFFSYEERQRTMKNGLPLTVYLLRVLFLRPQGQFALKMWESAKVPRDNEVLQELLRAKLAVLAEPEAGAADRAPVVLTDSQFVLYGTWVAARGQRLILRGKSVVYMADSLAPWVLQATGAMPFDLSRSLDTRPTREEPFVASRSSVELSATYDTTDDSGILQLARVSRLYLPSPELGGFVGIVLLRAGADSSLGKVWPTILPAGQYVQILEQPSASSVSLRVESGSAGSGEGSGGSSGDSSGDSGAEATSALDDEAVDLRVPDWADGTETPSTDVREPASLRPLTR